MSDAAQRRAYLQAMGIQPWVRRELTVPVIATGAVTEVAEPVSVVTPAETAVADASDAQVPLEMGVAGASNSRPRDNESGAVTPAESVTRDEQVSPLPSEAVAAVEPPVVPAETLGVTSVAGIGAMDWQALQTAVTQCTRCGLHASRRQAVFGGGNRAAEWMIVGEAPGEDEDQQGEPFVGASGQLLNNMLRATGLSREQVYLTNVIKCHPPNDRNPHVDEISQCFDYLQRQIALLQPRLVLAVGRVAAHALLRVNTPLGELRGQIHHIADIPLVVTYHPAYLLRKPFEKAKSWDDLRLARRLVTEAQV